MIDINKIVKAEVAKAKAEAYMEAAKDISSVLRLNSFKDLQELSPKLAMDVSKDILMCAEMFKDNAMGCRVTTQAMLNEIKEDVSNG